MFLFGPKKDKYYDIAQNLFTILADAAPEGWKQQILIQRDLMKKAKLCNIDSALALFFKRLPDEARPKVPDAVLERPFASVRLKKVEKEFYADFNIGPDGTICAIQFTFFPMDGVFEVLGVDFYPEILSQPFRARRQDGAFRISEKLVSILGAGWSETVPPGDPEAVEYCTARRCRRNSGSSG